MTSKRRIIDQLHHGERTIESLIGDIMIWHSEQGCANSQETYELIEAEARRQAQAQLALMGQEWTGPTADPVRDLVVAVHESLLVGEASDQLEPDERYYTDAINRYAVDQDEPSLVHAMDLLEQNVRESYLEDLDEVCAEIIREQVPAAVIPDDEP